MHAMDVDLRSAAGGRVEKEGGGGVTAAYGRFSLHREEMRGTSINNNK